MNYSPISPVSPISRRTPSKSAARNSALILEAIEREAHHVGLDQISVRAVATRAGLTSGAMYARYENVDEMLVALWVESIAQPFLQLIKETIAAVTDRSEKTLPSHVSQLLNSPTPLMKLGAEFIVIAQRNEAVGEVVIPAVSALLELSGLNEHASSIERAQVSIGASLLIGGSLRSFITTTNPHLDAVAGGLHRAFLEATPTTTARRVYTPAPIHAATGTPLRDALIDATAEVMSKTGFNGATISRIARKSDITSGSLYNFYNDKEELMNDAVHELMNATQTQNLNAKREASLSHQENFGLTDSFFFGLIPNRMTWLRFRQECILATRHHKSTHRTMKKVLGEIEQQMLKVFNHIDPSIVKLVSVGEQAIGFGYCALMGYTDLFPTCDFDAIMVQVAQQNGL
jgi:AcrR family transcriptional regulator